MVAILADGPVRIQTVCLYRTGGISDGRTSTTAISTPSWVDLKDVHVRYGENLAVIPVAGKTFEQSFINLRAGWLPLLVHADKEVAGRPGAWHVIGECTDCLTEFVRVCE